MSSTPAEIKNRIEGQKLPSPKFIRDPVHDIIKIEDRIILDILDTEPMQRLRFIKQLPLASYVYPGADHSRLIHSLGVYHLSVRMLNQLNIKDDYHRLVIKLAALLHDIGHGPFSHLFEDFLSKINYSFKSKNKHEAWTQKIIREDEKLNDIFNVISPNLKNDVVGLPPEKRTGS